MDQLLANIQKFAANYEQDLNILAEKLRAQTMPEITEALFSEFETCGNRIRYEAVYFGRRKFLSVLGLACVLWHRKEDIVKLEEVITGICKEECWALPAHVNRRENPDWRRTIDLFASETAQTLAQLTVLLKEDLSAEVVILARKEVFERVLLPFMESDIPYADWEQAYNNWNAVCCGCIGSAGLFLLEAPEQKKALTERITAALKNYYMGSFGMDGACQEGLGYWVYGFTYYMLYALQLKENDPGSDLLVLPVTDAVAHFQQKCYFYGGRTISFSDGDSFGAYPMGLTCCLALCFEDIRFPEVDYAQKLGEDNCWRWVGIYWNWYWTHRYLEAVKEGRVQAPMPAQTIGAELLSDAQWCILRGGNDSAVIAKGGNNGESHNHNDIGSFYYLAQGEAFLDDLGAGEYTKDYFSEKRYSIFCNRGQSHNIPIIDGIDQMAGEEYCSSVFTLNSGNVIETEFSKAYGIASVREVLRRISLKAEDGTMLVEDRVCADGPVSVRENLVTKLPAASSGNQILICGKKHNAVITIEGLKGEIRQRTVTHYNHSGKLEQVFVLSWEVPASDNRYQCRFLLKLEEKERE